MEYRKCEIKIYDAGILIGSYNGSYYIEHKYVGNNQYCKLWSKDKNNVVSKNNVVIYTRGTIIIKYLD